MTENNQIDQLIRINQKLIEALAEVIRWMAANKKVMDEVRNLLKRMEDNANEGDEWKNNLYE
jgi:CHASE3 domain sensor protein